MVGQLNFRFQFISRILTHYCLLMSFRMKIPYVPLLQKRHSVQKARFYRNFYENSSTDWTWSKFKPFFLNNTGCEDRSSKNYSNDYLEKNITETTWFFVLASWQIFILVHFNFCIPKWLLLWWKHRKCEKYSQKLYIGYGQREVFWYHLIFGSI